MMTLWSFSLEKKKVSRRSERALIVIRLSPRRIATKEEME